MMPEEEYAKMLANIGDSDRNLLEEVTKNIKNVIFGQQDSSRWINQRLIPGRGHAVWDHGQRVLGFLQESKSGRLQERLEQSMRFRKRLLELAMEISESGRVSSERPTSGKHSGWRETQSGGRASSPVDLLTLGVPQVQRAVTRHNSILAAHSAIGAVMQPRRRLSIDEEETGMASGILNKAKSKIFSEPELTQSAFKEKILSFSNLNMSEEEIDTLFSVLDRNGSGTVTHQKLTDLLSALAPEKVLLAMALENEDDDASDSARNSGSERPSGVAPMAKDKQEEEEEKIPDDFPEVASDPMTPIESNDSARSSDFRESPSNALVFEGEEVAM
jgi:hypothetical protein